MTSRSEIHKMEVLVCAKGMKCSSLLIVIVAVYCWWLSSVALCYQWLLLVTLHGQCTLLVGGQSLSVVSSGGGQLLSVADSGCLLSVVGSGAGCSLSLVVVVCHSLLSVSGC